MPGPRTGKLTAAWTKVRANKGAAGVDGQSLERFVARSDDYLAELASALRDGSYRPQVLGLDPRIRRVEIPKGPFDKLRRQDEAAGYPGGQGSHRADGVEARDRTDL